MELIELLKLTLGAALFLAGLNLYLFTPIVILAGGDIEHDNIGRREIGLAITVFIVGSTSGLAAMVYGALTIGTVLA